MKTLQRLKEALDYLGGSADQAPSGMRFTLESLWWGLWWGLLAVVIMATCGQASKFIYIDF